MIPRALILLMLAILLAGTGFRAALAWVDEGSRKTRAEAEFRELAAMVECYRELTGEYPTTEQGLMALVHRPEYHRTPRRERKAIPVVLRDVWNNPYDYRRPSGMDERGFQILSAGPDGIYRTKDDLITRGP